MADTQTPPPVEAGRTFLCVVDESRELTQALRFACRRASRTGGRVALLYVMEPPDMEQWAGVGALMQQERRNQAEAMVKVVASLAQKLTGAMPTVYIREGNIRDELIKLIDEEKSISVLTLGASTGAKGPGPIVSYIVTKMSGRLRIPITIVPGSLTDEQIDAIS